MTASLNYGPLADAACIPSEAAAAIIIIIKASSASNHDEALIFHSRVKAGPGASWPFAKPFSASSSAIAIKVPPEEDLWHPGI